MLKGREAEEILRALVALPEEQMREVQDFVPFLQERYGRQEATDESDAWTDEDLRDLAAAVLSYADRTAWSEDGRT